MAPRPSRAARPVVLAGLLLLHLAAPACRGPAAQTAGQAPDDRQPAPASVGARAAAPVREAQAPASLASDIAGLRRLVAVDQQAVELAEQQLARLQELAKAGRVEDVELLAAELELLQRRRALRLREWQLADAERGTAAAGEPRDPLGAAAPQADVLAQLVAMDRQAVQLAEQSVARQRSLAQAGRLTVAEVQSAELQLLQLRQALLRRERELAAAGSRATASAVAERLTSLPTADAMRAFLRGGFEARELERVGFDQVTLAACIDDVVAAALAARADGATEANRQRLTETVQAYADASREAAVRRAAGAASCLPTTR